MMPLHRQLSLIFKAGVVTLLTGVTAITVAAGGTAAAAAPPARGGPSLTDAPTTPPPATFGTQSAANRIVQGLDTPQDDLNDESTLCNGCSFANGNYAGFWQAILWADGFLAASGVDCEFGPNTAAATVNWQRSRGLGADGIVGPRTRGAAQTSLFVVNQPTYNLEYRGRAARLILFRGSDANYWIWWNNNWRMLRYTDKNIVGC